MVKRSNLQVYFFFLSVLSPEAQEPNGLISLAYVGAVLLAAGVLTLGVGLVRKGA